MGGLPEITEFLRRHRGGRSDDALRQDLLSQGHKPADIEAAFALSQPTVRFETQHTTERIEQESPGLPWGKIFGAFAVIVILATLAGLSMYGRGRRLREDDAMGKELSAYRPKALAKPERLELALPPGLIDADAGPDYGRLFSPGGAGPAAGPLLAAALTKRRCTAALNWYPATPAELARKAELLADGIAAADAELGRAAAAAAPGEAAAAAASRRLLFGWHMMQDFSLLAQARGLAVAQEGLRQYAAAARGAGTMPPEGPLAFGKLALELTAYGPQPAELRAILGLGAQREDFAALTRFITQPELRRPYLEAALLASATNWSEEEVSSGQLWPERVELLRAAGEAIDPRAARIGQGWAALAEALRKSVEEAAPEERGAFLQRARAALRPLAPLD